MILTPIVYLFITKLCLPVLPYLFACTFIADTASFLLPISNPINMIILSRFPLDLLSFLRLLFLPSLVVIATNIGTFFLLYRAQLKGSFDPSLLPAAVTTVRHPAYFQYTCVVLALVAAGYVTAAAIQFPLSVVAMSGATALFAGAVCWRQMSLPELAKNISWSIFGFIAGMFVVVRAIEDMGLTTLFGEWLMHFSGGTTLGAVLVGTAGSALGTNLINNVPMAVVMTSALGSVQNAPLDLQHAFVASTILGCNLGS